MEPDKTKPATIDEGRAMKAASEIVPDAKSPSIKQPAPVAHPIGPQLSQQQAPTIVPPIAVVERKFEAMVLNAEQEVHLLAHPHGTPLVTFLDDHLVDIKFILWYNEGCGYCFDAVPQFCDLSPSKDCTTVLFGALEVANRDAASKALPDLKLLEHGTPTLFVLSKTNQLLAKHSGKEDTPSLLLAKLCVYMKNDAMLKPGGALSYLPSIVKRDALRFYTLLLARANAPPQQQQQHPGGGVPNPCGGGGAQRPNPSPCPHPQHQQQQQQPTPPMVVHAAGAGAPAPAPLPVVHAAPPCVQVPATQPTPTQPPVVVVSAAAATASAGVSIALPAGFSPQIAAKQRVQMRQDQPACGGGPLVSSTNAMMVVHKDGSVEQLVYHFEIAKLQDNDHAELDTLLDQLAQHHNIHVVRRSLVRPSATIPLLPCLQLIRRYPRRVMSLGKTPEGAINGENMTILQGIRAIREHLRTRLRRLDEKAEKRRPPLAAAAAGPVPEQAARIVPAADAAHDAARSKDHGRRSSHRNKSAAAVDDGNEGGDDQPNDARGHRRMRRSQLSRSALRK